MPGKNRTFHQPSILFRPRKGTATVRRGGRAGNAAEAGILARIGGGAGALPSGSGQAIEHGVYRHSRLADTT